MLLTRPLGSLIAALMVLASPVTSTTATAAQDSVFDPPIVTVSFEGGTVEDYVETLRRSYDGPLNVIIHASARKVTLAPIELTGVHLDAAIEAIETLAIAASGTVGVNTVNRNTIPGAARIWRVTASSGSPFSSPRDDTSRIEIFALRQLTDAPEPRYEVEDIIGAIDAAIAMQKWDSEPQIRHHPPSGLLVVRGVADQIVLVREVLDRLKGDKASLGETARNLEHDGDRDEPLGETGDAPPRERVGAIEGQLTRLREVLEQIERHLGGVERELGRLRTAIARQ